jgi:predicted nucleic acid-binding protein
MAFLLDTNGWIAAIAQSNKLTLVTSDTAEFGRITGLQLEDRQS